MQKITSIPKLVLLFALSCSIPLATWYSNEIRVMHFLPSYTMSRTKKRDSRSKKKNTLSFNRYEQRPGSNSIAKLTDNPLETTSTRASITTANTPNMTPTREAIIPSNATDSIWDNLRSQFTLDTKTESAPVQAEIRKLLREPNKLSNIFKASIPYIYFIRQQVADKGLPAELALIPVIESEFNPNDVSVVGATGLWQFMAPTARELGIKVRPGYDGRRNVIASTKAALAYFKDLGVMFKGNWYLAIAAYNCGQGRVMSAMKKAGSNSFWNLPLPQETKFYVPRLLAVAAIVKNPEKYGVTLPQVENKPFFKEVKVSKPVNIPQLAKSTGIDQEILNKLNPDYTRGSSPKAEASTFLVPSEHEQIITSLLA